MPHSRLALEAAAKPWRAQGDGTSVGFFIRIPEELGKQFPSLAPEDSSPPHITFLYVGDVAPEDEQLLMDEAESVFKEIRQPVKAVLDQMDYFVHPAFFRRVAHCPVRFSKDMSALRSKLRDRLLGAGFDVQDSFPLIYRPHVTLAYLDGMDAHYEGVVPKGEFLFNEIEVWGLKGNAPKIPFGGGKFKRASAAPQSKTACVIAAGEWGGSPCLFKNRDRNYTPTIQIVHEEVEGTEIAYLLDTGTDWSEGMNEYGIGIVNSALQVGRDEAEKKIVKEVGKKSKDGERIRKALSKSHLDDVVKSVQDYKSGVKGHTLISDGKKTVAVEQTSKHDCVVKDYKADTLHVRTNHGHNYDDAGYTEGDDYISSVSRKDNAERILRDVEKPEDLAIAVMNARKKDRSDPNNMVRDTENMRTTTQIVMDLSKRKIMLYLIPGQVEFDGVKNKLPKGRKPRIEVEIYEYHDLDKPKAKVKKKKAALASSMLEKQWLRVAQEGPFQDLGEESWEGGKVYHLPVEKDLFLHFTSSSRAQEILKAGKLLKTPPRKNMGMPGVFAVSALWGGYAPIVQNAHIPDTLEDPMVGILFRTTLDPTLVQREQVIWRSDVPLVNPKMVTKEQAIQLLRTASQRSGIMRDDKVIYDLNASRRLASSLETGWKTLDRTASLMPIYAAYLYLSKTQHRVTSGATLRSVAEVLRRAGHLAPIIGAAAGYFEADGGKSDDCPVSYVRLASYKQELERQVQAIGQELGRELIVFEESSAKGSSVKIIENRRVVGHVSAADASLYGKALEEFFLEQARAGLPRPQRGRKASYDQKSCAADFAELQAKHPVKGLWFVGGAYLDPEFKGKGLGKLMYAEVVAQAARYDCAVGPDVCKGERTSPDAFRVWASLVRHFPHVGFVVWGGGSGARGRLAQAWLRLAAKYKNKKKIKTQEGDEAIVYEYSEKQIQHRNREKAKRVEKLRKNIDKLRASLKKDLSSKEEKKRLTALAICLIDETFERVGNDGSAKEGHFGVTGWKKEHVSFSGNKATIKYVGKSGVKQNKEVTNTQIVSALKKAVEGKGKGDPIFCNDECSVTSKEVNEYLKPFDVTAKDLRGFHANREMQERLKAIRAKGGKLPEDKKEREKKLKEEFKKALEETAESVGHEPSTLKSQYLVPGVEDEFLKDGEVSDTLNKKASHAHVTNTCPECGETSRCRCPGPKEETHDVCPLCESKRVATKSDRDKLEEQAQDMVKRETKKKPPRYDLRKTRIENDDPDTKRPSADNDKDLSKNYKKVGSSLVAVLAWSMGAFRVAGKKKPTKRMQKKQEKQKRQKDLANKPPVPSSSKPEEEEHKAGDVWEAEGHWVAKNPGGESHSFETKDRAEAYAKGIEEPKEEEDTGEEKPEERPKNKGGYEDLKGALEELFDRVEVEGRVLQAKKKLEAFYEENAHFNDVKGFEKAKDKLMKALDAVIKFDEEDLEAIESGNAPDEKGHKAQQKAREKLLNKLDKAAVALVKLVPEDLEGEEGERDPPEDEVAEGENPEEREGDPPPEPDPIEVAEKAPPGTQPSLGAVEDMEALFKSKTQAPFQPRIRKAITSLLEGSSPEEAQEVAQSFMDSVEGLLSKWAPDEEKGYSADIIARASKALAKDPSSLGGSAATKGKTLAEYLVAVEFIANPRRVGGKGVTNKDKTQEEYDARAIESFKQYRSASPEFRQEALNQIAEQMAAAQPDSAEYRELDKILDGLALSAIVNDESLVAHGSGGADEPLRREPTRSFRSLAKGIVNSGQAEQLLISTDKLHTDEGRRTIQSALEDLDDEELLEVMGVGEDDSPWEPIQELFDGSDDYEMTKEQRWYLRGMMQRMVLNEMTTGQEVVRVFGKPKAVPSSPGSTNAPKAPTPFKPAPKTQQEEVQALLDEALRSDEVRTAQEAVVTSLKDTEYLACVQKLTEEGVVGQEAYDRCREQVGRTASRNVDPATELELAHLRAIYVLSLDRYGDPDPGDPTIAQVREVLDTGNLSELDNRWVRQNRQASLMHAWIKLSRHLSQSSVYTGGTNSRGPGYALAGRPLWHRHNFKGGT